MFKRLFAFAFTVVLLSACSCGSLKLDAAYVAGDQATYDHVADRFVNYSQNDPALKPSQKDADALVIQSWKLRLDKGRKNVAQ